MKMHLTIAAALAVLCFGLDPATAAEAQLPADVASYVEQREGCDHFRGEIPDPPDEQRMKDLEREIDKLCKGTDQMLVKLKRKYAKNRTILKRLNQFETDIASPLASSRR